MTIASLRTAFKTGQFAIAGLLTQFAITAASAADSPQAANANSPDITLVSATAVSALTPANAVVLAYKFQSGQFVHYSGRNRVQYVTQLEDRAFNNSQTNETGSHFRVVTVDEQGLALIEPVLDRTRMVAKMHDKQPVVFDSSSSEPPSAQFVSIRDSIGRVVARFQVAPNGKLVKAIIVDTFAPQSLRDSAEKLETRFPFLIVLPTTPVSVGDKWREEYSTLIVNDGLKESIPLRRIYELASIADGIATIKFRTVVLRSLTDPELDKQIIQQTPNGVIEFDIEQGLVRSYSSSINRSTMNAFGPRTLFHVVGESVEKLETADSATPSAKAGSASK